MYKYHNYKIGFAPSDIANNINPNYRLPEHFKKLAELAISLDVGFELEMENDFSIMNLDQSCRPKFIGVHQPSGGVDVIDDSRRLDSINKIKQSMEMAQNINADYYTIHLETVDRWHGEYARKQYINKSKKAFEELMAFHNSSQFTFPVYIENLEYPKYPATKEEIKDITNYLKEVSDKQSGVVFDVGHLWRSRNLLSENNIYFEGSQQSYSEYLKECLGLIDGDIKVFHITGCGGYMTHLLPQINIEEPNDNITHPNEYYFRTLAKIVLNFVEDHEYKPIIVNEAFGHPYETVIENCEQVLDISNGRA